MHVSPQAEGQIFLIVGNYNKSLPEGQMNYAHYRKH